MRGNKKEGNINSRVYKTETMAGWGWLCTKLTSTEVIKTKNSTMLWVLTMVA